MEEILAKIQFIFPLGYDIDEKARKVCEDFCLKHNLYCARFTTCFNTYLAYIDLEKSKFCDFRALDDSSTEEETFPVQECPFEKVDGWSSERAHLILSEKFFDESSFVRSTAFSVNCGFCCGKPRTDCGVCFDIVGFNVYKQKMFKGAGVPPKK